MHRGGFAQAAEAFGVFGLGQVAASGARAHCLARGGDFNRLATDFFVLMPLGRLINCSKEYPSYAFDVPKQGKRGNKLHGLSVPA
jgi:hypothetical protein